MIELYNRIGEKQLAELRRDMEPFETLEPTNVLHHCVFSYNISTITQINFKTDNLNEERKVPVSYEDGDGTVIGDSLKLCEEWSIEKKQKKNPIIVYKIPNAIHGESIHSKEMIAGF
jgi:hypothetical protein